MNLKTAFVVEGVILVCAAYLMLKLSFPLPSRRAALRQDQEEALARAQRAWKTADHDYFEEHRLEKRLLPISLNVFLFGLGTVFLSSALAANSSAIPRAISIAAVTLQIVAALTFIIIQLRKRGRVWSEIQQAWASNGEQEKTG